jgi:hypothetical protein
MARPGFHRHALKGFFGGVKVAAVIIDEDGEHI